MLSAQDQTFHERFKRFTNEHGLSGNTVKCLLQGRQGFIWLGSADGLNRYDGRQFRVFRSDKNDSATLSDNDIYCMAEDDKGLLWLGHRGAGISVFNPVNNKVTRYRNIKNDSTSLNSDDVRAICRDIDGEIWIGTGKGLCTFDEKTGTFKSWDKNPGSPQNIFALCAARDGFIWIGSHDYGSRGALFRFNKNSGEFFHFYPDEKNQNSLRYPHVVALCEDKSGNIWIGMRGYLDIYSPGSNTFRHYDFGKGNPDSLAGGDFFRSQIFCDSDGNVWFGTSINGLYVFNYETGKFTRFLNNPNQSASISSNVIRAICEDKSRQIWIGTTDGGVNVYDKKQNRYTVYQPIPGAPGSLAGGVVSALYEDKNGKLWVGVKTKGVDLLDRTTDRFNHYVHEPGNQLTISNNDITGICGDGTGTLWVSSFSGGLCSLDTRLNLFHSPGGAWINGLFCDSKGMLWIIPNQSNLGMYNPFTKEYTWFEAEKERKDTAKLVWASVTSICEDSAGKLWIGTIRGLSFYDRISNQFTLIQNKPGDTSSLSDNYVNALYLSKENILWVATNSALDAYDIATGKCKHYRINAGTIAVITGDESGNLWFGTNNGLIKFNPAEDVTEKYSVDDGLPDKEFTGAFCRGRDGRFYFGTINGFFSFQPTDVTPNPHIPEVRLSRLTVLNKPWYLPADITYTGEITLSYREYFFTIEFTALEFTSPENNHYAYKLDGFNREWVFTGNDNKVTFTNLDAGDYFLKVKASNNSGIWSDEKKLLRITITPPWWKTKTFYSSCIAALILIIWGYIKWRERKLKEEKRILLVKVNEATAEIRAQKEIIEEKNRNITDSIEYSKRIQDAILPSMDEMQRISGESFIFHRQRDIIGGDFYFIAEVNGWNIIALADCTGHGVPGALMSMLGKEMLNEIVNDRKITTAGEALDLLTSRVTDALNPDKTGDVKIKEGMDIAFIAMKEKELQFSGAKRPLIVFKNGIISEYSGNESSVGGERIPDKRFKTHLLTIDKGNMLYLFTDGFGDQFGGPKQKKFKSGNLKKLLIEISEKPVDEQKLLVEKTFNEWKGEYEQTDDVTVIGIRI
ncbi:MAG: SpoIIE family protein phosphatase [Bacteroidetes bacterium]|nr:SpoIIE family protein phosphatase [Bacteroidota bacterium]